MKIIKIYLLVAMATLAVSCDLKENPYGIYSEQNLYETEEGAQSVLLAAYRAYCNWEYMNLVYIINDLTTDVAYNNRMDAGPSSVPFAEWDIQALAGNEFNTMHFKGYYRSINNACDVIQNVPGTNFSPTEKDRLMGEAYFLRGYAYYNLVTTYGKVPLKTSTTDLAPKFAQSIDEVWARVIEDLEEGEKLMPIGRRTGCADKVAAWAALSRAYLFLASAKKHNVPGYENSAYDVTDCYTKAAYWAGKVVDNPEQTVYYLDPDIYNVFDVEATNGPEQIFLITHNRTGSNQDGDYTKTPRYFMPGMGGTYYVANPKTGEYELSIDGWSITVPTQTLLDDMTAAGPSDKRLTFFKNEYFVKDGSGAFVKVSMTPQDATHYIYSVKHFDALANGNEQTACPIYMIRFADVVLVYAEALGRDRGVQWLNKVTERVGGKTYRASDFTNDDTFRAAVLEERKFELCFEGKRLEDLKRTHNIRAKVHGKKCFGRAATDLSAYTDEELTYLPMPLREIELNPSITSNK